MSENPNPPQIPLQWRLECLGHSLVEHVAGLLPGSWAFRLGEALGGLVWHFMPLRQRMILRNLRIAYAGEKDMPELRRMAKAIFRRTGANLISAAHTARLKPEKLRKVIEIENLALFEQALAKDHGVVLLLSHMGNWEILSRLVLILPEGVRAGAFFRPLNNLLMDAQVLKRRQQDGTRMFSRRDSTHHVAGFLREGGVVGILADQRVGRQGGLVPFFGRVTRASPLPSLLARRSKSTVLALAVTTVKPGKWRAEFLPVEAPYTTPHCMEALEKAMKSSPIDVFWFQERWKVFIDWWVPLREWLGPEDQTGAKPHRALLWLADAPDDWRLPAVWTHPDLIYEAAIKQGSPPPDWLPASVKTHAVIPGADRDSLRKIIARIDESAMMPLDYILTRGAPKALVKAARREAVPLVSLP